MRNKQNSHIVVVGILNATATLGKALVVSILTNHTQSPYYLLILNPRNLPKRNEKIFPYKELFKNAVLFKIAKTRISRCPLIGDLITKL